MRNWCDLYWFLGSTLNIVGGVLDAQSWRKSLSLTEEVVQHTTCSLTGCQVETEDAQMSFVLCRDSLDRSSEGTFSRTYVVYNRVKDPAYGKCLQIYLFFSKDAYKLIKRCSIKTFIMLQNISISNKYCSFELSIKEYWKKFGKKYWAQLFLTLIIIIRDASWVLICILEWFLKDHVTLKTEVWCRKFIFDHRNRLYKKYIFK